MPRLIVAAALAVAFASTSVRADEVRPAAPLASTVHRHMGGYFRPDLGFGYMNMGASQGGTDVSLSGVAGTFGVAAGYAIAEDHILAFHVWDSVMKDPSVTVNGTSSNGNGTITLLALGPQYTYYLSSFENTYFSITPALTRATVESNGNSADTNWGFGLRAAVGKEWWVSDHWGLGVAAHVSYSSNQDSGTNPPTWSTWAGTLAFSATFN